MITKRQYLILSFFLTRGLFLGTGISVMLNSSGPDTLIASILGIILGFILVSIYYQIYQKKNPLKLNIINKILLGGLIIVILNDGLFCLTTLISSFYLIKTPPILIASFITITIFTATKKGLKTFARVAELLMPYAVLLILIKTISFFPMIKMDNFFPILNENYISIIKSILIMASLTSVPQIMLLSTPKEKLNYKEFVGGYLLGSISILLLIIPIIGVFGFPLARIYRFPEYMILKKLNLINFLEHLENIFSTSWIIDIFILGGMCSYIFNDKIIENKKISKFLTPLFLMGMTFLAVFVNSHYPIVLFLYNYTYLILLILAFCYLLSLILIKKKSNN